MLSTKVPTRVLQFSIGEHTYLVHYALSKKGIELAQNKINELVNQGVLSGYLAIGISLELGYQALFIH